MVDYNKQFDRNEAILAKSRNEWLTPPEFSKPTMICDSCGEGIYQNDEYYDIDDKPICKDCAQCSLAEWFESQRRIVI